MASDWREALMKKHKKLFFHKGNPTFIGGIACGEGWRPLIETLCEYIQFNIDNNDDMQGKIVRIKEKLAGLRFYYEDGSQRAYDAINFATALSYHICEMCGAWVDKSAHDPKAVWKLTLCKTCEAERVTAHVHKLMEVARRQKKKRKCGTP